MLSVRAAPRPRAQCPRPRRPRARWPQPSRHRRTRPRCSRHRWPAPRPRRRRGGDLGGLRLGGGRGILRGALGRSSRLGHGLLRKRLDQFDDRHRSVVALARPEFDDPGVPAVAGRVPGRDLGEQLVHDGLVLHDCQHPASRGDVAALGERDQPLGDGPQSAGLRLRGGDPAVLEERGGEVGQHEPLVGGAPTQPTTLGWGRHVTVSFSPGRPGSLAASAARICCGRRTGRVVSTARFPRTRNRRPRRSRRPRWGRSQAGCPSAPGSCWPACP